MENKCKQELWTGRSDNNVISKEDLNKYRNRSNLQIAKDLYINNLSCFYNTDLISKKIQQKYNVKKISNEVSQYFKRDVLKQSNDKYIDYQKQKIDESLYEIFHGDSKQTYITFKTFIKLSNLYLSKFKNTQEINIQNNDISSHNANCINKNLEEKEKETKEVEKDKINKLINKINIYFKTNKTNYIPTNINDNDNELNKEIEYSRNLIYKYINSCLPSELDNLLNVKGFINLSIFNYLHKINENNKIRDKIFYIIESNKQKYKSIYDIINELNKTSNEKLCNPDNIINDFKKFILDNIDKPSNKETIQNINKENINFVKENIDLILKILFVEEKETDIIRYLYKHNINKESLNVSESLNEIIKKINKPGFIDYVKFYNEIIKNEIISENSLAQIKIKTQIEQFKNIMNRIVNNIITEIKTEKTECKEMSEENAMSMIAKKERKRRKRKKNE